jgi:hypothetical protein
MSGVYNPISAAQTTVRVSNTFFKPFLQVAKVGLAGKALLDAGVYVGALVVCSAP